MSVCLNCLDSFVPGKSNRKGFCSLQCWRAYEHSTRSHNCLGVGRMNAQTKQLIKNREKRLNKKNLGEVIEELEVWKRSPKERAKIKIKELSPRGKQDLKEALELNLKYLKLQLK